MADEMKDLWFELFNEVDQLRFSRAECDIPIDRHGRFDEGAFNGIDFLIRVYIRILLLAANDDQDVNGPIERNNRLSLIESPA